MSEESTPIDDISKLSQDVDKEIKEEEYKEAKKLIKSKRHQIANAEKIIRQLRVEEADIIARLREGV